MHHFRSYCSLLFRSPEYFVSSEVSSRRHVPRASFSSSLTSFCFYFVFLAKTSFASSGSSSEIDSPLHCRSLLRPKVSCLRCLLRCCGVVRRYDASPSFPPSSQFPWFSVDWSEETMHLHLSPSSSQFCCSSLLHRLLLLRHVYSYSTGQHEGVFLPVSYAESNGEVGTSVGENKSGLPRLASSRILR